MKTCQLGQLFLGKASFGAHTTQIFRDARSGFFMCLRTNCHSRRASGNRVVASTVFASPVFASTMYRQDLYRLPELPPQLLAHVGALCDALPGS